MILKCSSLPTGLTLTASYYDTTTAPETLISSGNAWAEEGATGVYTDDVGSALDAYSIVRVRFSIGADAWVTPGSGTKEVVTDPALLGLTLGADMTRFSRAVNAIVLVTVGTGSTTTNIVTSSLDPASAVGDQFRGRILTFAKDTTTAVLRGQATDVTANTAGGELTVTALTTPPVSGDVATLQ